jgi:ABC-type phosphate/phosphonate transport system permease subunit
MKRADSLITWFGELTTRQQTAQTRVAAPDARHALADALSRAAQPGPGGRECGHPGGLWSVGVDLHPGKLQALAGFTLFGWTPDYLMILWRSVVVAFFTTLVSVILSYPLCFLLPVVPNAAATCG